MKPPEPGELFFRLPPLPVIPQLRIFTMKPMPKEPTVFRKGTVLWSDGDSYEVLNVAEWDGRQLRECEIKSRSSGIVPMFEVTYGTWPIGYEIPAGVAPATPPRWNRKAQRAVLLTEMTTPLAERLERLK